MKGLNCWLGALSAWVFALFFGVENVCAEIDPRLYAVEVSAVVSFSPAQIQLVWPGDTNATAYTVFRKGPEGAAWVSLATLPGSATNFIDDAAVGSKFEYHIRKTTGRGYSGNGYVLAGVMAPLVESRGKVLLLVDDTHAAALAPELTRLEMDLAGDGWTVARRDVSPTLTPPAVKALIKSEYDVAPTNLNSVLLFGHIAVPRSGDIDPDGHANHRGAWAADTYYADINGVWTDSSVTSTNAERQVNHNVPGDGKFDQGAIPSDLELAVGRVDFFNLTCFANKSPARSERDLLRQYLNKDHQFRHAITTLPRRGLVCDNFGEADGEAYAADGWRNFAPLFGAQTSVAVPYGAFFPTLVNEGFLWSYGTGGGGYTTANGIGGSDDFALNDIKAAFLMFFGSYFGDWDNESNFLRAALGSTSHTLTVSWSGRPHWFYHRIGLGEPIGVSARLSQNNGVGGIYEPQDFGLRSVSSALLGDPTLRLHPVIPPSSLNGGQMGVAFALNWNASSDTEIQGYHVYRSTSPRGPFNRLNGSALQSTSYLDLSPQPNTVYMVRAVKLETSGSGTYFNPSQGIFVTNGVVSSSSGPGPGTNGANSATFVKADATTRGNWKNVFGAEGNWIYSAQPQLPSFAQISPIGASEWIWNESTDDPAAPQLPSATSNRVAACWYSFNPFAMNIRLTDGNAHLVSAYFLDWDEAGRQTQVEIVDGQSGAALHTQVISNFSNGLYLTWEVRGHVQLRLTPLAPTGGNAALSALFLDPKFMPPVKPAARWVRADHVTRGNWKSLYGSEGAIVVGDQSVIPSYGSISVSGKTDIFWTNSTSEVRAPMRINDTNRVAAEWQTSSYMLIDINITDAQTHQISLYAMDWPRANRGIVVEVLDGETNKTLNRQDLGNYNEGKHLVWDVKGHIKLRLRTYAASPSVTISGLFFQPASSPL